MSAHTLRWRSDWARIAPGRHDAGVAHLTVSADAPPTRPEIERCVMELRAGGYDAVVTSALGAADAAPFVDAGFGVRERLQLLGHDLNDLPHCTVPTRRARRRASTRALVNTQLDDTATLALHESCGFCRLPVGLCVLGRAL